LLYSDKLPSRVIGELSVLKEWQEPINFFHEKYSPLMILDSRQCTRQHCSRIVFMFNLRCELHTVSRAIIYRLHFSLSLSDSRQEKGKPCSIFLSQQMYHNLYIRLKEGCCQAQIAILFFEKKRSQQDI
jgi:hypothetical protein